MWQCSYAKEPFDTRLFALKCIQKWKVFILGTIFGAVLVGGIYYLVNVTFGGRIPYVVTNKYYVEYAMDPDGEGGDRYSYFEAITFEDFLKSDEYAVDMAAKMTVPMTKEEFITYFKVTLLADLRVPYITVMHPDKDIAVEMSDRLTDAMNQVEERQKEVANIRRIDVVGPTLEVRDIRILRAIIFGGILGAFITTVSIALFLVLDEKIYVPETFTKRYGIPTVGYVCADGEVSVDVATNLEYLFRECKEIGEIDAANALALSDAAETLRAMDGNLLLIHAGETHGKTIENILDFCNKQDIKVTAALLVDAQDDFIYKYRFGRA